VSDGNLPNLAAAAAADEIVVVEQRPFEERNFAGRRGTDAYDRLRRDGSVVGQRGVLGAVEAAVSDGTGATTDRTGDGTGADDAVADDRPATGGDGRFPSPPPSRYSSSSSES
jgi:iron complex transport system ATP-binding protein